MPRVQDRTGVTDGQLGLALLFVGAGALPAMLLVGRALDRWGLKVAALVLSALGVIGAGMALTAVNLLSLCIGLTLVGASSGAADVAALNLFVAALGLAVAASGTAVLFPTLLGIVSRNVNETHRGRATSVVTTVSYLGFLLGPVYVGLLADATGLRGAMAAVAALAVALFILTPALLRLSGFGRPANQGHTTHQTAAFSNNGEQPVHQTLQLGRVRAADIPQREGPAQASRHRTAAHRRQVQVPLLAPRLIDDG